MFYDVIGLHDSDGLDLDSLVKQATTPVVAVTTSLRPDLGEAALRRGAQATICLGATADDFLEIIDAAQSGNLRQHAGAEEPDVRTLPGAEVGLTRREAEVVALIVRGRSNRRIGEEPHVSAQLGEELIRSAYRKMDVVSRTQAVAWGVQHGFALEGGPAEGH